MLDLWFAKRFKKSCQGEAYLTRFADDFVVCFQYKHDTERFERCLTERMRDFGLELAREKTRLLLFGRFARERMAEYGKKPETFEFLGFKHVCGIDRNGKAAVVRIPSTKSCRKFLDRTQQWLRDHLHWRRRDQQRELALRLRSFYQYSALSHTLPKLFVVLGALTRQWRCAIRRCGRRSRSHWVYLKTRPWFELPHPKLLHPTV